MSKCKAKPSVLETSIFGERRSAFRPRSGAGRAFLSAVPWIDAGVIALIFIAFTSHTLLLPGRLVDLPPGEFTEGLLQNALVAIVQPVERPDGVQETFLFLDDERYSSLQSGQRERLNESIRTLITGSGMRSMNLLIDRDVPMSEMMLWFNLLRDAGVQQVNVVERPR